MQKYQFLVNNVPSLKVIKIQFLVDSNIGYFYILNFCSAVLVSWISEQLWAY